MVIGVGPYDGDRLALDKLMHALISSLVIAMVVCVSYPAHADARLVAKPCGKAPAEMACIPGGPFIRGLDANPHRRCWQMGRPGMRHADTLGQSKVWLQTFYMDKTEVTTAAYRRCVTAGKCNKAGPRYSDFDRPRQPITGISWFDAVKFCKAHGKHLPTEAEWEKAARGPKGALYPWGNAPVTCDRAVIRSAKGRSCGVRKRFSKAYVGRVLEVASRPAGAYGLFDMVGNAEEWVADWYSKSYRRCGAACAGPNPKGPCGGALKCRGYRYRSVRGGSWYWPKAHATGVHRRPHFPHNRPYHHFGFRCAASATQARALEGTR